MFCCPLIIKSADKKKTRITIVSPSPEVLLSWLTASKWIKTFLSFAAWTSQSLKAFSTYACLWSYQIFAQKIIFFGLFFRVEKLVVMESVFQQICKKNVLHFSVKYNEWKNYVIFDISSFKLFLCSRTPK